MYLCILFTLHIIIVQLLRIFLTRDTTWHPRRKKKQPITTLLSSHVR